MGLTIRQELPRDYEKTEEVIKRAFEDVKISDKTEHYLVSRLRRSDAFIPALSLVAINGDGSIVGHILFSKAKIEDTDTLALAPVSVVPEYQNRGIGRALIKKGLKTVKELGFRSVIVLGHPTYYPKFGFKKASIWGIKAPWNVPDEVFMALELKEHALEKVSVVVQYPKEFFAKMDK